MKIDSEISEWTAFTPDPVTGERQYLTNQADGIFDLDAITSPKHGYAVITQTNELGSNYGAGNRISIFNLFDRKIIMKIEADSISGFRFRNEDTFIYKQGWNTFCLFNILTQEKKCLQSPESVYDGGAILSQNGRYLVALQSNNLDEASSMLEAWGNRISILDLDTFDEVLAIQETDIHDLQFIEGSLSFLYMRQRKTPCIFDISTLTKKCINQINTRFPNDTIQLDKITEAPQSLTFFHWGGEEGRTGGLCFFSLYSGYLNCPMDGLADLKGQVVTEYEISPDEKYILFTYEDDGCPICDWAGNAGLAVVSKDGKNYYNLGPSHSPHWGGIPAVALWRPMAQPNNNP